jgi:glycerol kinase
VAKYVAALDQGTTSTRFIVFDGEGREVASAQKEHLQIFPQAGWVEHDPREILLRTEEVIEDAMTAGGIRARDLAGVGIANQRETVIVWDRRTGAPSTNAIVWQDMRVAEDVARYARAGGKDRFRRITGLPLSTYFSALKLKWILDRVPGAREKADAGHCLFGTVDSYLAWHLTGGVRGGLHITDVTNASRTQLMNLETLRWDAALLDAFGIPACILPEIRSSSEIYGEVRGEGRLAALAGVPLAAMLGDQQAALAGQTCFQPGEAKNTYGTGCFLLMNTGETPVHSSFGLLTTLAFKFGSSPAVYALEGSVAIAGALVQWMRDNLGLIEKSADVEALAASVPDNGGVYFVPAFSGLYAPYWNEKARGLLIGLTRFSGRGHVARAALEAAAFQTREIVEAMEKDSSIALQTLRVDGGMTANRLLMQFQADILNRRMAEPSMRETTALGAAYAAGLAVGFFASTEQIRALWKEKHAWEPHMCALDRERQYRNWKRAVERCCDWLD